MTCQSAQGLREKTLTHLLKKYKKKGWLMKKRTRFKTSNPWKIPVTHKMPPFCDQQSHDKLNSLFDVTVSNIRLICYLQHFHQFDHKSSTFLLDANAKYVFLLPMIIGLSVEGKKENNSSHIWKHFYVIIAINMRFPPTIFLYVIFLLARLTPLASRRISLPTATARTEK